MLDALHAEKDERELWVERFEKEHRTHSLTSSELMSTKNKL